MASRTNKQWILKKKQQLEKLKILKKWWKRYFKNKNLSQEDKINYWLIFELENPKWNKYVRDKSWRKILCVLTWLREDSDLYRLCFKANSNEVYYNYTNRISSRLRRFINKNKKNKK